MCSVRPNSLHVRMNRPTILFGFGERLGSAFLGRSPTYGFHDVEESMAGVGEAIEVVLALAAAVNDSTVPQKNQVVAHHSRAQVKQVAESPDVVLSFREQADDLESGRVTDWLEQVRRPLDLLCTKQTFVHCLGRLRGLVHAKAHGCHHYVSPEMSLTAGGWG